MIEFLRLRPVVASLLMLGISVAFWALFVFSAFLSPSTTAVNAGSDVVYFHCHRGLLDHASLWLSSDRWATQFDRDHEVSFDMGLLDGVLFEWTGDTLVVLAQSGSFPSIPPYPILEVPVRVVELEITDERFRAIRDSSANLKEIEC